MVGVAFLFVPIQTMCYVGIPPGKNNNVSGMTNLARNVGGSVGISLGNQCSRGEANFIRTAWPRIPARTIRRFTPPSRT